MTTNPLNRMSALFLTIGICFAPNFCSAQGTSDKVELEASQSIPLNDREPTAVPSVGGSDIPIANDADAEEPRTPDEFLSTSRASIPASEQIASGGPAQFWAIHELILASIAIDGVASHEVLNQISASTLSDEHKELLFARFAGRGDGIAEEFTSESRGWLQDAGGKISRYAKDRYPQGPSPTFRRGSHSSFSTCTVQIRNSSGWNVAMEFSGGVNRSKLQSGMNFPSVQITGGAPFWVQLQQPNGQWGTKWRVTYGGIYNVVYRGGNEPLVLQSN